jgi:hypothetical protein
LFNAEYDVIYEVVGAEAAMTYIAYTLTESIEGASAMIMISRPELPEEYSEYSEYLEYLATDVKAIKLISSGSCTIYKKVNS